jgi:hypothetical protein
LKDVAAYKWRFLRLDRDRFHCTGSGQFIEPENLHTTSAAVIWFVYHTTSEFPVDQVLAVYSSKMGGCMSWLND